MDVQIDSPTVKYTEEFIEAEYDYRTTKVIRDGNTFIATPKCDPLNIKTKRQVPKLGVMLVGWGGNNGSTLSAAMAANKRQLSWETKRGAQHANWYGSITQCSTVRLGSDSAGEDVYVPLKSLLPMVEPDDLIVDGWDISDMNIADACKRAGVLEPLLLQQIYKELSELKPRPSIYDPDFIAANQKDRANHLIKGTKQKQVEVLIDDINDFKVRNSIDTVIILWTANTERFCDIIPGVNDTESNLKKAIGDNHSEISPSTLFAYAAITCKCVYINGSPQNTFVPGILEYAERSKVFVSGDDFKSGQTKFKSVLVDFLISAGIKPVSIVSYNHLGNNDGKNLSAPQQFRSKEISKSNVVDDMVKSNKILYKTQDDKPDHSVVIKYVPYVGDSKRAMDEYTSEIMLGGLNTIVVHNTCEDSLLAVPIILDLIVLSELCTRITFKRSKDEEYSSFRSVLAILSYLCKAPLVPKGAPVVNALFRQRMCIENILRACLGLPADNNMLLEHKITALIENVGGCMNGDH